MWESSFAKRNCRFIPLSTVAALVWASGLATTFVTQSAIAYMLKLVFNPGGSVWIPGARSPPQAMREMVETRVDYSYLHSTHNSAKAFS